MDAGNNTKWNGTEIKTNGGNWNGADNYGGEGFWANIYDKYNKTKGKPHTDKANACGDILIPEHLKEYADEVQRGIDMQNCMLFRNEQTANANVILQLFCKSSTDYMFILAKRLNEGMYGRLLPIVKDALERDVDFRMIVGERNKACADLVEFLTNLKRFRVADFNWIQESYGLPIPPDFAVADKTLSRIETDNKTHNAVVRLAVSDDDPFGKIGRERVNAATFAFEHIWTLSNDPIMAKPSVRDAHAKHDERDKQTLVVNLYGAPGAGKSTGAAYIFYRLKDAGVNVELATEYAKDKVWEHHDEVFKDQCYIFGHQHFRISRLIGKVDVIVTDSPLLLGAYYSPEEYKCELSQIARKSFTKNALSFFIDRTKPYNPKGRFQTEEESNKVRDELLMFLDENGVNPVHVPGEEKGYSEIVERILEKLQQ